MMVKDMATPNNAISSASTWCEYTSTDFVLADVDLTLNGKLPRRVVMKEAGDLKCKDAYGDDATLTGLPQWYMHDGAVQTILQGQTAAIIVYW